MQIGVNDRPPLLSLEKPPLKNKYPVKIERASIGKAIFKEKISVILDKRTPRE